MKRKTSGMKKGWSGSPFHTETRNSGSVPGSEQVSARAARLGLVPAAPDALRLLPERRDDAPLGALSRLLSRTLVPLAASSRS